MRILTIIISGIFVSLLVLTHFLNSNRWMEPIVQAIVTAQESVWEKRLEAAFTEKLLEQFIQEIPATQTLHRLSNLKEDATRSLAAIYMTNGEQKKAIKILNDLVEFNPKSFRNWMLLGEAYLANGETAEARTALTEAYAINPAEPTLFQEYAALLESEDDTGALTHAIDLYKAMPLPMNSTQLFYTGVKEEWSEANSVTVAAPLADGKMHTIEINLDNAQGWDDQGTVVQFRLDPVRYAYLDLKLEQFTCTGTDAPSQTWNDFSEWTLSNHAVLTSPNTLTTTGEDPFLASPEVQINPAIYTHCAVTFAVSKSFISDFIDAPV